MAKGQEYLQNVIASLHVQIAILQDQLEAVMAENERLKTLAEPKAEKKVK